MGKVFACRCRDDLRRLTPPSAIPLRALRPLSQTGAGLNHFGHFYERAVTQRSFRWPRDVFHWSRFERRLPCGRGRLCLLRAKPTRLESRSPRRYASSVTEGLVSPLRACAQGYCARGVPTKLAPAHVPRVAANGDVFRVTLLWGPRDPNIQLLPYVVTHGHTRRSSRSSSARGCRLCPRCLPAVRLAPPYRPTLERHDRPSEEPCLLQWRLRPISRPSLSRSSPQEGQALYALMPIVNRARGQLERAGISRHATWVAAPKWRIWWRFPPLDSPPSSEPRTPRVVSRKPARLEDLFHFRARATWRTPVPSWVPRPWADPPPRRERIDRRSGCLEPFVRARSAEGRPFRSRSDLPFARLLWSVAAVERPAPLFSSTRPTPHGCAKPKASGWR